MGRKRGCGWAAPNRKWRLRPTLAGVVEVPPPLSLAVSREAEQGNSADSVPWAADLRRKPLEWVLRASAAAEGRWLALQPSRGQPGSGGRPPPGRCRRVAGRRLRAGRLRNRGGRFRVSEPGPWSAVNWRPTGKDYPVPGYLYPYPAVRIWYGYPYRGTRKSRMRVSCA